MAETSLRDTLARSMQPGVDWSRFNQPFGELKDTNPVLHALPGGMEIRQNDIDQAMSMAMGFSGGGLSTKGIKAYHSSPHDFERFDLSKIGSGEGAQAYGHGLYFAENPAISGQGGQYWRQFLNRFEGTPEAAAAQRLKEAGFDRAKAIEQAQRDFENARSGSTLPYYQELKILKGDKPVGPRTYEVNINADPARMLDWDKPMGAQSGHVIDAMRLRLQEANDASFAARQKLLQRGTDFMGRPYSAEKLEQLRQPAASIDAVPGRDAYKQMGLPAVDQQGAYVQATDWLRDAGVPGIKYLDAGSRGAGQGSSNYVVFDPAKIDILKKYGIAATAGLPVAAAAASGGRQSDEGM